jgi:hypothetical protein
MPVETVRIENLHLRVPGVSADEARRIGEEVARRVADLLPSQGRVERLSMLDLRVSVPLETPRDRLAEEVARAIVRSLA